MKLGTFDSAFLASNNDWLQELVILLLLIPLLDRLDYILAVLAYTVDQSVNSNLDSFPSLVTIHRVVPADDSSNLSKVFFFHEIQQILGISLGRGRCRISTISEKMDVDVRDPDLFGSFEESEKVVDMGVYASVGDLNQTKSTQHEDKARETRTHQTQQMQPPIPVFSPFKAINDLG